MTEPVSSSVAPKSRAAEAAPSRTGNLSERVRSLQLPTQAPASSAKSSWLPWTLCGLLSLAVAGMAYRLTSASQVAATAPAAPASVASSTSSGAVGAAAPTAERAQPSAASSGDVVLESKGYIIPAHQILVSPKVSGMIVQLSIEEGRRVQQGEVLAQLEDIDYKADLDRAQANLAAAECRLLELENGSRPEEIKQAGAELAESEARLSQLQAEWKRNDRLRKSNSLAEREFELAESDYKAMDRKVERLRQAHKLLVDGPRTERIDVAKAEVKLAQAELIKAKWRLDNCTIKAPISGTILKKNAEEGNIVNPIAFNGSFSLCEMANLADLEVELNIQERDISRVFKGQRCQVRAEAFPDRVYEGVVSRLMPIADRAKGAVPVRVELTVPSEEEGVYLRPEMGAVVSFFKPKE